MKLAIASLLLASAAAFVPTPTVQKQVELKAAIDDLQEIAAKSNPVLKFYDPLQLSTTTIWGETNAATIEFLRHAEIKHGRVAMAAFVGKSRDTYIYIYYSIFFVIDFTQRSFLLYIFFCRIHCTGQWNSLPLAHDLRWNSLPFGCRLSSGTMGCSPLCCQMANHSFYWIP